MEAKATARTVLVVPRKTRLVTRLIQGKSVEDATNMLSNMNKKSARLVNKVLLSATANAENNLKLDRITSESILQLNEVDFHNYKRQYETFYIKYNKLIDDIKNELNELINKCCFSIKIK